MECFSGLGAAGLVAASSFSYNRENFQGDREQRRRAAVKVMTWRVEQTKLWRQDVRDLISLTEYKMHMYLIVNVLVLGFTIFLWTEGRLPEGTPQWLMLANIISIGAAFMFLLLSIWLAMNAAVAAQSFEVRLLTQMVRLPVPTWEELEATRTHGAQFEKLEGRQMFRVPWAMGVQENLVGGKPRPAATPDPAGISNPDIGTPALSVPVGPAASRSPAAAAATTAGPATSGAALEAGNVDPWGLERAAEGFPELGCGLGSDVAKLRHVRLSRQAAIQWQTFDAFSRVSMSMGVQQLFQAMSYYMLGYLLVQVRCKEAAVFAVILFTMMGLTTVKLDMTLDVEQLRLVQLLLISGPVFATVAALDWINFENAAAEFIVPLAFISHGLYLAVVLAFCRIRVAENGAWLPVAFRSVLYLDVFSWARAEAGEQAGQRKVPIAADSAAQVGRPASQAVRYVDGRPVPLRPEDMIPRGVTRDLCDAIGAPNTLRPARGMQSRDEEFYNPASFLPVEDVADDDDLSSHKQGWSEKVGPGELPWRVFCAAMCLLCVSWFIAAAYSVHGAKTNWSLDLSVKEIRKRTPDYRPGFVGPEPNKVAHEDYNEVRAGAHWHPWTTTAARVSFLAGKHPHHAAVAPSPERVMLSWPWPNISPSRLTCDASGSHFVLADRILMFSGMLDSRTVKLATEPARATLGELDCPAVLGEGLEDVAISCSGSAASAGCQVLALHSHGRRIAACPLGSPGISSNAALIAKDQRGVSSVEEIGDKWLEKRGSTGSRTEKAASIAINPECNGEVGRDSCTVLGTTHGRVLQLGRYSGGKQLIPTEVLYEEAGNDRTTSTSGIVRALNRRYLGVLQPKLSSIHILDLSSGGLPAGSIPLLVSKPVASFCAGGGYVYLLTRGPEPEMWRIPIPQGLTSEAA